MNRRWTNILTKVAILIGLIALLMYQNKGDIVYIYANF